jgi:hypothetical protein
MIQRRELRSGNGVVARGAGAERCGVSPAPATALEFFHEIYADWFT